MNQKFHASCFVCVKCHRPITGGLFHMESGEPYCETGGVLPLDHFPSIVCCLYCYLMLKHWHTSYSLLFCLFSEINFTASSRIRELCIICFPKHAEDLLNILCVFILTLFYLLSINNNHGLNAHRCLMPLHYVFPFESVLHCFIW